MVKQSFSSEHDQNDLKEFKETLGSFGTTTKPGGNQLLELQTKVRQGVKHVELHLSSTSKGEFGVLDVPDKYGFEQRRTIMQLAKLNKQTLSVHGTFNVTSFSGFSNSNFDDATRFNAIKEIDETIKFAAETAKSGAVVFHIQGDGLSTDRGELNISKKYLYWLEEKAKTDPKYKKELDNLKKNYFDPNPLNREFVSNPEKFMDVKNEFNSLPEEEKRKYFEMEKNSHENKKAWELYFIEKTATTRKLSPDNSPLIVVGDKLGETKRNEEIIDVNLLKEGKNKLSNYEKKILNKIGIDINDDFDLNDFQKAQAIFSSKYDSNLLGDKISEKEFNMLKDKLVLNYDKVLSKENYLQAQADKEFHKKYIDTNIKVLELQKEDLKTKYELHKEQLEKIKKLEDERRAILKKINTKLKNDSSELGKASLDALKQDLNIRNLELQHLINDVGYQEYQELSKFDETISTINEKKKELETQKEDVKAVTDVVFEKNTSAIGHLGIKALKYQLDLRKKSKIAPKKLEEINSEIDKYTKLYHKASSDEEKNKYSKLISRAKTEKNKWVGLVDYNDIDLKENPLYLAPENMLPGMGSLTSLEEYKAVMRMSQEEFANRILSNEEEYKKLKEEYEKETGIKIKTHEDALKLAKRHLAGTFDNAHAGVWLKHFKKLEGESEEHRIERFNKWLNSQAEEMAKEGLIKHIHLNDTQAKDDDHNLLGSGVLDLHDLKDRLRRAGIKEALIVEAGGRGATSNMHLLNAFSMFNPSLSNGYSSNSESSMSGVSDWMSVKRDYETRPQYSQYGMSYSTFRHVPPKQGQPKGNWSGTGFL